MHLRRALTAEAIGTFALVFAGTLAIIVDDTSGGAVSHVGVALVFGLVVLAMIQAFGDVSGAHFNPAVSLAFVFAGRFPARRLVPYWTAQFVAAVAASACARLLFPLHPTLGATLTSDPWSQAFALEVVFSFFLMLVILSVSSGSRERGLLAGIAIGSTVAFGALCAGPISGASMNPARSFGPAIASGRLENLWLYFAAPALGMLLSVPACRLTQAAGCCGGARRGV